MYVLLMVNIETLHMVYQSVVLLYVGCIVFLAPRVPGFLAPRGNANLALTIPN